MADEALPPTTPATATPTDSDRFGPSYSVHFVNRDLQLIFRHLEMFDQFIRATLPPNIYKNLDIKTAKEGDTTFLSPQTSDRFADVIWEVDWIGKGGKRIKIAILIENQVQAHPFMPMRILIYLVRLWEKELTAWESSGLPLSELHFTLMIPLVFHVGTGQWTKPKNLKDLWNLTKDFDQFIPQFTTIYWSLFDHDQEELLNSDAELFQTLAVAKTQGQSAEQFRHAFLTVMESLASTTDISNGAKKNLAEFAVDYVLNKRTEKEWDNLTQEAQSYFNKIKGAENMMLGISKHSIVGKALYQGLEEGLDKGGVIALQDTLRSFITKRFGTIPQNVEKQIAECNNLERLRSALLSLYDLPSINHFKL